MKIAALQMVSTPSVERNLEVARNLIAAAAAAGARLVALPEYFCFMGRQDGDKLAIAEAPGDGPIQRMLADAARRHDVWVIGGTLPLQSPQVGHVYNANCVYAPDGTLAARYDKIHLFCYDNGREAYDEGRVLLAGRTPVAFEADGWRIGLSVCYDLRFPELYRILAVCGARVIVVPSAFTRPTGEAGHWEVLLRARAIENQAFVVAADQVGPAGDKHSWGGSMIVDPWGEVLARRDAGEGYVVADLDFERQDSIREQLPSLANRVPNAYRWPEAALR
jgi:deaminated glutathione amidase